MRFQAGALATLSLFAVMTYTPSASQQPASDQAAAEVEKLDRELSAAGFSVRYCRYFFHGLYPIALAINAVGVTRATHTVAPPRESLLHRAVGRWFAAEPRLLPGFLPGTSLVCVASPRTA